MNSRIAPILVSLVIATMAFPLSSGAGAATETHDYIVVLKDSSASPEAAASDFSNLTVQQTYHSVFSGFAASIPDSELGRIQNDPRVLFVTPDDPVQADGQTTPTGVKRVNTPVNKNKGTGIGVAVIDTGIDLRHPDLKSHIVADTNCVNHQKSGDDDNGHGSHIAGTIGAINNKVGVVGVAPGVDLIAVKVLDAKGSGSIAKIICGIDWVTANAAKYNIKVANMSLGGKGKSDNNCGNSNNDAMHLAICNSTKAGITYVVAAGNSGANANTETPAGYDDTVITVSALADSDGKPGGKGAATQYGPDDTFATFSNYGNVVDIAAPGVAIHSTWKNGGYNTIDGTSMATPHVSGGAALYLKSHPGAAWNQVRDGLVAAGEKNGAGHSDPSGKHPEPVLRASKL